VNPLTLVLLVNVVTTVKATGQPAGPVVATCVSMLTE